MTEEKRINETMLVRNGKLVYAVQLRGKASGSDLNPYIFMENGEVRFNESGYLGRQCEFDFSDDVHVISKQLFVEQLRTAIRSRLLELRQLDLVLTELGLRECIETFEEDVKLLTEFSSCGEV